MTSSRSASSPRSASAGGQDEQPCEVNSSTTTGPSAIAAVPVAPATPAQNAAIKPMRFVIEPKSFAIPCKSEVGHPIREGQSSLCETP